MVVRPVRRRWLLPLTAASILAAGAAARGQPAAVQGPDRLALVAAIEGPIGPATARHVGVAVRTAQERRSSVLVLRLNTPGGLATSMREIITTILASTVPVVGFVAPPGAHAASAGTYILYATHVAAMSPGTNLGAATPVQIGGGFPGSPPPADRPREGERPEGDGRPPPGPAEAKAINDAVAFLRSLAELHGRNADWAELAVREAASLSAQQAREMRVIDLVADDVPALLEAIDGRTVAIAGATRTLATRHLTVERLEPGTLTHLLAVLANPNVAFLLLLLGVYGLIFELANPGAIGPGVVGAICLVLGLYALNQLPLNYAGLALVLFGLALMVAEGFTPAFGVLGAGGAVALVIGAVMLLDADIPAFRLSWWVIGGTAMSSAAVLILLLGYVWRVQRQPPTMSLVGTAVRVVDWSGAQGHVWAAGERWRARGQADLTVGASVPVRAVEGLTLVVGEPRGPHPSSTPPTNHGGAST